jgi:chromosome segregation ATPase
MDTVLLSHQEPQEPFPIELETIRLSVEKSIEAIKKLQDRNAVLASSVEFLGAVDASQDGLEPSSPQQKLLRNLSVSQKMGEMSTRITQLTRQLDDEVDATTRLRNELATSTEQHKSVLKETKAEIIRLKAELSAISTEKKKKDQDHATLTAEWRQKEKQLRDTIQFSALETKALKDELGVVKAELQRRMALLNV